LRPAVWADRGGALQAAKSAGEYGACYAKFKMTALAKFKLPAAPVGWIGSLGEEASMDTIREALTKRR